MLEAATKRARAVLLLCILCFAAGSAWAGDITVRSADSEVINQMHVINAEVTFEFSDDALEAMRSGVALIIDVDFRIKQRRRYMWDPDVQYLSRRYRIERHALTNRYVITDLVTDDRRIHDSIEAAVRDLGRIRAVPVFEVSDLDASRNYRIGIRARLDLESLPAPLRPIAYISPSWRMSSGWYQWTLIP